VGPDGLSDVRGATLPSACSYLMRGAPPCLAWGAAPKALWRWYSASCPGCGCGGRRLQWPAVANRARAVLRADFACQLGDRL